MTLREQIRKLRWALNITDLCLKGDFSMYFNIETIYSISTVEVSGSG